jgi:hypothetical protein
MKKSVLRPFDVRTAAIILALPLSVLPATDSLVLSMETYFSALKEEISRSASTSVVNNAAGAQLFGYFTAVMKKNPPLRSLTKVNARGKVMGERLRSGKHAPAPRSVARCDWFSQTAKNLREQQCVVVGKNGRADLYWTVPLLRGGAGKRRFGGALIAVVDLRECFRAIARAGAPPFLVRLDDRDFFAHSWKNDMIFIESRPVVPGVENIILRYQNSNVSAVQPESAQAPRPPDTLRQASVAAAPADSPALVPVAAANPPPALPAKGKRNIPAIIILGLLIAAVSTLIVLQIAGRIAQRRTGQPEDDKLS